MRDKPIGIPRSAPLVTVVLAVGFVVCWSSGFVGAKLTASDTSVLTVLMWRFLIVAVILLPFLRSGGRGAIARWSGAELVGQVVVGLLSQTGYTLTVYWAIALGVSTGTTALIDGIQPLVVASLAAPLLGLMTSRRQWIGLGLGLLGVAVVTWADVASPGTEAPLWAYAVPLLGMLSLVGATFVSRLDVIRTTARRALAVHCAASAVVYSVLAVATGNAVPPASGKFWLAVAWLVVLATLGAYGAYWALIERVGITSTNALLFLVPGVTTLWGAALYGEPLTALTIVGLALALAAAATVVVRRRSFARPHRAPRASRGPCR
ncbi:DMT family transporter [Mumia sp. ZJ1417]|uniref:DMT family transporter n=1 Tax=Mumia sp. ZJ1417 TaxID=2708082 RepID=UPI00141F790D|nr:DMT family transporter [Mumia sp. ZJ1417]QMW65325.1 DMT family transporter [Mumia sp. ZJ1417]